MKDRKISLPHPLQPPSLTPTTTSLVVIYHHASESAICTLISPLAVWDTTGIYHTPLLPPLINIVS